MESPLISLDQILTLLGDYALSEDVEQDLVEILMQQVEVLDLQEIKDFIKDYVKNLPHPLSENEIEQINGVFSLNNLSAKDRINVMDEVEKFTEFNLEKVQSFIDDSYLPNKPRHLTEEEMDYVLSSLPDVRNAVKEAGHSILLNMKERLKEDLRGQKFTPLSFDRLKQTYYDEFMKCLIKPGSNVGMWATSAMGHPFSQLVLNTFHSTGSAVNVSCGIERVTELSNLSVNQKNPACSIFFKDQNLTVNDVFLKKRPELCNLTLKHLVIGDPEILSKKEMDIMPYWYNLYETMYNKYPDSNWFLRLELDTALMYSYKITSADIIKKLENDKSLICIASPMSFQKDVESQSEPDYTGQTTILTKKVNRPFIDIYPIEDMIPKTIKEMDIVHNKDAGRLYLQYEILEHLDYIHMGGLNGIKQLYPIELPVLSIVAEEIPLKTSEAKKWRIKLNESLIILTGVRALNLLKLILEFDIVVNYVDPLYIDVTMPESSTGKPSVYMLKKVNDDEREAKELRIAKERDRVKISTLIEPTKIQKISKVVYADSTGTNLQALYARDDIDETRTLSNNVHEIHETLGIEAVRSFLITEYWNIITYQGLYIDPIHIGLLCTNMTNMGQLNGITPGAIKRTDISVIHMASIGQTFAVIVANAGVGTVDKVRDKSSSVAVGKRSETGTGINKDYMNAELVKKYINPTKEKAIESLKPYSTEDILNDLDNIDGLQFATDQVILENDEEEFYNNVTEDHPGLVNLPYSIRDLKPQPRVRPAIVTNHLPSVKCDDDTNCKIIPSPIVMSSSEIPTDQGPEKPFESTILAGDDDNIPAILQQQILDTINNNPPTNDLPHRPIKNTIRNPTKTLSKAAKQTKIVHAKKKLPETKEEFILSNDL